MQNMKRMISDKEARIFRASFKIRCKYINETTRIENHNKLLESKKSHKRKNY